MRRVNRPPPAVDDDDDEYTKQAKAHGCLSGGGYSWCEAKNKCLRAWEEDCTEGDTTASTTGVVRLPPVATIQGAVSTAPCTIPHFCAMLTGMLPRNFVIWEHKMSYSGHSENDIVIL